MVSFGRDCWCTRGEGFAVAFTYFAAIAPLHVADGRLHLRWPFAGLARSERVPGSVAVVAVMLGSVCSTDTVGRPGGKTCREGRGAVPDRRRPELAELLVTGSNIVGLHHGRVARRSALRVASRRRRGPVDVNSPRALHREFVSPSSRSRSCTSSPITSRCSCAGPVRDAVALRPVGQGRDPPRDRACDARPHADHAEHDWYVQVGALVAGHVIGLAIAHDRARRRPPSTRSVALRSQLRVARADGRCTPSAWPLDAVAAADRSSPSPVSTRRRARDPRSGSWSDFGWIWLREGRRRATTPWRRPECDDDGSRRHRRDTKPP